MTSETSLRVMTTHSRADRIGLWIALALGALLMLAAALAGADEAAFTAKRTDHFNATLPAGSKLRIENISGDIVAVAGKEFSAVVTITVAAASRERASELLRLTTIEQRREDDELLLQSHWPYSERWTWKTKHGNEADVKVRSHRRGENRCEDCKITAQYQVTVPAGIQAVLHTVNGEVRSDGTDADLELQSVNGPVTIRGARRGVSAESVNGKIDVAMQALAASASLSAKTVNGAVLVTLPKDAHFDLTASTMNGTISSTFPLPVATVPPEPPEATRRPDRPAAKTPRRVIVKDDGADVVVDVEELQKEIEEAMKQVDVELRDSMREYSREMRRFKIDLHHAYNGSIGQGGAKLRLRTLNGPIAVLAAGTHEGDAKTLVPERRGFAVTIPEVRVQPRAVVIPRVVVVPGEDESVVRGNVDGDFLATSGGGTYRIGRVTGKVKILTHSGEIHVAAAGAGADLTSYGGDIHVGPVTGDLKAKTLAGEIRAGAISGAITLETSGGDVRVESAGGPASVRTAGGDIILRGVRTGSVDAETGGGDVRVALLREARGGVSIRNAGGDVTLTVPPDFHADVELEVQDADSEENLIRSDFPEISVSRQRNSQRGAGTLNGGGPKVVIRTHSGTIRLRKAAS
jgi:DUF4097 and DUF4098 domain-containing protein YvlB